MHARRGRPCSRFSSACLAAAAFAAPARAAIQIESFSTDELVAGRRSPDLGTHFKLGGLRSAGIAKNVIFNAPQGVFGNPNVLSICTSVDFALSECQPNSQVGADHDPRRTTKATRTTCSGRRRSTPSNPQAEEAARFAFIRPDPQHPDLDSGRGPLRDRLRAAIHGLGHHPADARWQRST